MREVGLELLSSGAAWAAQRGWTILSKVASALTGRKVPVRAGSAPCTVALRSPAELDTIYLPSLFLPRPLPLKAALSHEALHILKSTPLRLGEISYAVWLMANGLEDGRIEVQSEGRFPGIRLWIRRLLYSPELGMALKHLEVTGQEHQALSAIVKALYILLAHRDPTLARRISGFDEAVVLAQDLLPQAEEALRMEKTTEVVELAKRLLGELEQAIERRKQEARSPAAKSFYQSASQQLQHARMIKAADVIKIVEQSVDEFQNKWHGPWYRGGGYSFPSTPREVEETEEGRELAAIVPGSYQLLEWLLEADPLKDQIRYIERQRVGRLTTSASALVKAATGKYRHVFSSHDDQPQPILPAILQQGTYWFLLEAHMGYSEEKFQLLKLLVASYARLFELLEIPFLARAWSATIPEITEIERDEKGEKKVKTYMAKEGKLHIASFDPAPRRGKRWAQDEVRFLSIRPLGFNIEFEGVPKGISYRDSRGQEKEPQGEISEKEKKRQKIVLCFGNIRLLNVLFPDLKSTMDSLRSQGYRFVYFNVGGPPETGYQKQQRKDWEEKFFDRIVDAEDLRTAFIQGLQNLLLLLGNEARVRIHA
jgi:flagellin-specific chaperone FliS